MYINFSITQKKIFPFFHGTFFYDDKTRVESKQDDMRSALPCIYFIYTDKSPPSYSRAIVYRQYVYMTNISLFLATVKKAIMDDFE